MRVYVDLVAGLNFLVDFLLMLATNRLCGYPPETGRAAAAAALGGVYGGVCLIPDFHFLGSFLWRMVSFCAMTLIAFGLNKSAVRRGAVFILLSMALGGLAMGIGSGNFWSLMGAVGAVAVLCIFVGSVGQNRFVPVELSYGDKQVKIMALRDTGNTLRDPVTGSQVLVVGADVAQTLTGLTKQQLMKPVESMGAMPGLRLVPYRAVGQSGGMLLALRLSGVKIGHWKGSSLVAFAPEGLSSDGTYQALTGGAV